ncbi:MAG: C25 family cysteine peptidase [Bacteroidales bacterium]
MEYVILGGDSDPVNVSQNAVPHRGLFALDDEDIPADMYYACLDGSWNDDGDSKWGEAGEFDLYAEVAIGRLCVDNATEIQYFVNKLIKYQDTPVVSDIENALMIGEELNNNPLTYGGDCKDEIVYGTNVNGFSTVGISSNFAIETLYDRDGGWNKYNVFNEFNTVGVNLLNHLGHSSTNYNMKMTSSDVTANNFTNDGINRGFVIGYSQGCYNGSFDNRSSDYSYGQDCFAEKITTIATAEVASIANSRYGWYAPGNTNSSSQFLDRQFFDAIFGDGITRIGYANASSKEDNGAFFNDSYIRWTAYELNLFGDPSMDIWTEIPVEIVASYPSAISIGSSEVYFETDIEYSRIALVQNGELIGRLATDISGNGFVEFFNPVSSAEPIEVSIIGHNKNRHLGSINVELNQAFVLFDSFQINDPSGNVNGIIDFGEKINLGLTLINVGDQTAHDVLVTLSTNCEYVTITDDTENYGNFSPGESIFLDNVFEFVVTNNVPDNYTIEFEIMANGQGLWSSTFDVIACAPELGLANLSIADPSGNNNGRLDPGENAMITIEAMNNGLSNAPETMINLMSTNGLLTITSSAVNLETLETGETASASFDVQVSPEAPMGSQANLFFSLSSGFYNIQAEYSSKIGLLAEDWETGNFNQYNWSSSGHEDWTIENAGAYEGTYCARSGAIGHDEFSILKLNAYQVVLDDSISFYVKVSSENSDDFLNFYIDSDIIGQWSGTVNWQRVSFPVSAGTHSFKWFYDKDGNTSFGSDCAWIDYIELPAPPLSSVGAGPDGYVCNNESFECQGYASNFTSVEWSTSGTGYFSDPYTIHPVYSPGPEDINTGHVTLSLTAFTNDGTLDDDMELYIYSLPEIDLGPDITAYLYEPVFLDAGLEGMLYNWSTGETTQEISVHSGWVAGVVDVSVQVTNTQGCTGFDEISISFEEYTGIQESLKDDIIEIYPNPSTSRFYIRFKSDFEERAELGIYNSMGRPVYFENDILVHKDSVKEFSMEQLPKGIYYLKVQSESQQIIRKILVQ